VGFDMLKKLKEILECKHFDGEFLNLNQRLELAKITVSEFANLKDDLEYSLMVFNNNIHNILLAAESKHEYDALRYFFGLEAVEDKVDREAEVERALSSIDEVLKKNIEKFDSDKPHLA